MRTAARIGAFVAAGLFGVIGLVLLVPGGCFWLIGFDEAEPYVFGGIGLQLLAGLVLWLALRARGAPPAATPVPAQSQSDSNGGAT